MLRSESAQHPSSTRTPESGNTVQLRKLLRPRSIALVGASTREHSAGLRILRNLKQAPFPGRIYPVNPRYTEVEGLTCYPDLASLPETPESVFIAIPAADAVSVLDEAGRLGIQAAMINGTGFADAGADGMALQQRLVAIARKHAMKVCGPNNSGFINLWDRVYPSTFYTMPRCKPGPVAVITQSGSIAIALSQDDRRLGLGYIITAGNEALCGIGDYLDYVLEDDRICVVLMFIEVLRDPTRFAAAARKAATLGKRIVVTKGGRSDGGMAAVAAHSGAVAGDDALYDAFFRACGVARARDLDEMIETAVLLKAYPRRPTPSGVAVVTVSGGEAGLIADLCDETRMRLPELSLATVSALRPNLSPTALPRNPVDAMGLEWNRERWGRIVHTLANDQSVGAIAVAIDASASGLGDAVLAVDMAEECVTRRSTIRVPLVFFTNTSGGGPNQDVENILSRADIPVLCGMRAAIGAIGNWAGTSDFRELSVTPDSGLKDMAQHLLAGSEVERARILDKVGVPMVASTLVQGGREAVVAAEAYGYPVVLKGTAPDILHKTEAGLVRTGLRSAQEVTTAFEDVARTLHACSASPHPEVLVQPMLPEGIELLIAVRNHALLGSITVVGVGGTLVEVIRDVSVRLGPVSETVAREMLRETRAGTLLDGVRGKPPSDSEAAARAIAALSRFGHAAQEIAASIEINPFMVATEGNGGFGVDVLVEPAVVNSNA